MNHSKIKHSWTAIVPAAGFGSRLGHGEGKIFFPILGKTMLEHLVELLNPCVQEFVFVLAPRMKQRAESILSNYGLQYIIKTQEFPRGMADAVLCTEKVVRSPHCLVIWGDQIALTCHTLQFCQSLHLRNRGTALTFPTYRRFNPYIDFKRDSKGQIIEVFQAREGNVQSEAGETDCGVFCFDSQVLFQTLRDHEMDPACRGVKTKEFNLLPLIPILAREHKVETFTLEDPEEAQGINTVEDAQYVENILRKRNRRTNEI